MVHFSFCILPKRYRWENGIFNMPACVFVYIDVYVCLYQCIISSEVDRWSECWVV